MKLKPINMTGPEVRAILSGRKTQFRRVMKPQPVESPNNPDYLASLCPIGQPDDRLWVRETWCEWKESEEARYKADFFQRYDAYERDTAAGIERVEGWSPSIHMPRWASRITLEIAGVRVERLKDISENDACAEGVEWDGIERPGVNTPYRGNFYWFWESIHAKRAPWSSNPWVWVLEFKMIDPF